MIRANAQSSSFVKIFTKMVQCKTVSETFYNQLVTQLPSINRPDYLRLFGVLAFGTKSKDTKDPLVPRFLLAQCQGKERELLNGHYIGKPFLDEFSKNVFPLKVNKWYITDNHFEDYLFVLGKAREVKPLYPKEIENLNQQERKGEWRKDKKVYLDTGQEVSEREHRLRNEQIELFYSSLLSKDNLPIANELIQYMNRMPERMYSNLRKYIPMARQAIPGCGAEDEDAQMDLLQAVDDHLRVHYGTTDKSPRIFGLGQNITYLYRPIRKILTQDWIEADIQSSQLCIAAHLWQMSELEEFLQNGGKIWDSLFETFNMPYNEATKDIFKVSLYACMYGAIRKTIMKKALGKLNTRRAFATFKKNKWISMIWAERANQLLSIKQLGGAKDAFGRWIKVDKQKKVNEKSVLAQVNQSWELKLLVPLINYSIANESKGRFRIALWQHDGFSLWIRDKSRAEQIKKDFKKIFDASAKELGFKTSLEFKD